MQELNSLITQDITVSFGSIFAAFILMFLFGLFIGRSRYQTIEFVLRQKIDRLHEQLLRSFQVPAYPWLIYEEFYDDCEKCAYRKNCKSGLTDKLYYADGSIKRCFKFRRSIIGLIKEKVGKFNAKSNTYKE